MKNYAVHFFAVLFMTVLVSFLYINPYASNVLHEKGEELEAHESTQSLPYHFVYTETQEKLQTQPSRIFSEIRHSDRFASIEGGFAYGLSLMERVICWIGGNRLLGSQVELCVVWLSLVLNVLAFYFFARLLESPPSLALLFGLALGISPVALSLIRRDLSSVAFFHWPLVFAAIVAASKRGKNTLTLSPLIARGLSYGLPLAIFFVSAQHRLAFFIFFPLVLFYFYRNSTHRKQSLAVGLWAWFLSLASLFLVRNPALTIDPAFLAGQFHSHSIAKLHPLQLLASDYVNGIHDINPIRASISELFLKGGLNAYSNTGLGIRWCVLLIFIASCWRRRRLPSNAFLVTGLLACVLWLWPAIYSQLVLLGLSKILPLYLLSVIPVHLLGSLASTFLPLLMLIEMSSEKWTWWKKFLHWMDPVLPKVSWLMAAALLILESPPLSGIEPYLAREPIQIRDRESANVISLPYIIKSNSADLNILLNQIRGGEYRVLGGLDQKRPLNQHLQEVLSFETPTPQAKRNLQALIACLRPKYVIVPFDNPPQFCGGLRMSRLNKYCCEQTDASARKIITEEDLTKCSSRILGK